jgi:CRP-like cAMP-binding protein
MEIYRTRADGTDEGVALIAAGTHFGEPGPTLDLTRSASVPAHTKCGLTSYPLRAFRQQFPHQKGASLISGTDNS